MTTKINITISNKIKNIRKLEDLTQKKLAELTGIPHNTIKRLEGKGNKPSFEVIQKLCSLFPQYTLYLIHDEMPLPRTQGQITPEEQLLINTGSPLLQKEA